MSSEDDDRRIRAALTEAHRDDASTTPSFARVWGGARRPRAERSPSRWVMLSAGVAAAILALVIWRVQRPAPLVASLPGGTRSIAPTDFLLETPDLVTLRTLPTLEPAGDRLFNPSIDRRDPR